MSTSPASSATPPTTPAADPPDAPPVDPTPPVAAAPVVPDADPAAFVRDVMAPMVAGAAAEAVRGVHEMYRQPVAPAAPAAPVVTARDIDERLSRGESAADLIEQRARDIAREENASLRADVESIRNQGTAAIATLAENVLKSKPKYADLKPEIDRALRTMTAAERANPAALDAMYHLVVGANYEKLAASDRERELRQVREREAAAAAAQPGGVAGRRTTADPQLDPRDYFNETELNAIEFGGGMDKYARRMGCKTVQAMLEKRKAFVESRRGTVH